MTVIHGSDGLLRGIVAVAGPAISGHVLAMSAFGDVANFEFLTKHAGDGASAFFLVQECGSASRAAGAAIRTARDAAARFAHVAAQAGFERETLRLNAAVHWGERVLVGNLVSAARLGATAFDEEVSKAARVEGVAKGGSLLATKALLERLDATDAAALSPSILTSACTHSSPTYQALMKRRAATRAPSQSAR